MQGGVRTSIVGFLLTTYDQYSTTWGQGRQPSIAAAVSASASSAPVTSSSRDLRAAARSCASCVPRRVVATTERWSLGAAGHPSSGGGGGGANVSRDASVATRPVTSAGLDAHGPEQPRTPPAGNQAWGVGDLTRQKMTHGEHSKVKSTTPDGGRRPRQPVWRPDAGGCGVPYPDPSLLWAK